MNFDFDKQETGDWFTYFRSYVDKDTGDVVYLEPEPDAAEFCIRLMTPFFTERMKQRKKEHKMVLNPSTRQMERVSYFVDQTPEEVEQENLDAWDYAITDWRNVNDAKGQPVECTPENKIKMSKVPEFIRFVNRVFQILAGLDQELLSKNSLSG
jgi:hypothetical protein